MNSLPRSTSRLPQTLGIFFAVGFVPIALAEPSLQDIAPAQTRLVLAQTAPAGAGAAVSSEALATQPNVSGRLAVPKPGPAPSKPPAAKPAPASSTPDAVDPLLDPARPRNCQLTLGENQTISCGTVEVVLPQGVYKQVQLVENPEGRRATDLTDLKRQQPGLGYIRYLSDEKLRVGGQARIGGLDVPIRPEDHLPVRIWYKKMTEVDDATKALTFILPPVGLIAGAGAWSSGNTLVPDVPPVFEEARDYFLREPSREDPPAQPAFRTRPAEPAAVPGQRIKR